MLYFPEPSTECGGILTGITGKFGFIDGGSDRLHNTYRTCSWEIRGNTKQDILLNFTHLNIGTSQDCSDGWIKVSLVAATVVTFCIGKAGL